MKVVKSNGETMRSFAAYWYVCGEVRSGHWKGWGELRKDEGKRNVEERRGLVSEESYPFRPLMPPYLLECSLIS